MSGDLPKSTDGWAFFLDIDGTLIDIASTPDAVIVPPELPILLDNLRQRTGGALALITGRDMETVDRLLHPARPSVGAIHGTQLRLPDGEVVTPPPAQRLAAIRERLAAFTAANTGSLFEDKGTAVAVHFRGAPALADIVEAEVRDAVGDDDELIVQPGKMVFEIRPAHADKGRAVADFMQRPPFHGKRPVAVGDDVTDETMFKAAVDAGGCAIRVGTPQDGSAARASLADPAAVRDWLDSLDRS
ncbi:MAG: trehalose-phosphatase [Hyphomicrobiales bacterium]|nr:trehalose-phosphatase [Hyphomicrobiales bacterium]